MSKVKKNQNKKYAGELEQIVKIQIDKIRPNREQSTGIRDKEKFELLVQDMKIHGQNQPIRVRRLKKTYELIIGYHRTRAAKKLGWKNIKTIISDVDADEAAEICLADNMTKSDYSPKILEDMVSKRWSSGKYKSRAQLGKKIGLTGEWVSDLLKAKEFRDEVISKAKFNLDDISTWTMLYVKPLIYDDWADMHEAIALLKLVKKGDIKSGEVKSVVENLLKWSNDMKDAVLYKGVSYHRVKSEIERDMFKKLPKGKKISIQTSDPELVTKMYNIAESSLPQFISGLDDKKLKGQSINYTKVMFVLMGELLYKEKEMSEKQFESIRKMAGVEVDLHSYAGEDLQGLTKFY